MTACLVTMLFNLADKPDASSEVRPLDFYVKNGKPTLEINYPMVIFCDEETKPLIEPIRGDRPTIYVVKNFLEYDHVKFLLPIVTENRRGKEYHDHRNTPTSVLLYTFKFTAMFLAKREYKADTYMWLDFGGSHILRGLPNALVPILHNPRKKIGICYIQYQSKKNIYPMSNWLRLGGYCCIGGTAFTVASDTIDKFYTLGMSILYEQVFHGVGHTEEQILIYMYDRHPELFSIYFGDYGSILKNYHATLEDVELVKYCFIGPAENDNRRDLAQMAKSTILSS